MKNKELIKNIDAFYRATSLPIKIAKSVKDDFNDAENFLKGRSPQVLVKNARAVSAKNKQGRGYVSQFMAVSTKAHKPGNLGFIPDEAFVFIFLEQEYYVSEGEFPEENERITMAKDYASKAGLDMANKYVAMTVGKSKVLDKGWAENRAYSYCVGIFSR